METGIPILLANIDKDNHLYVVEEVLLIIANWSITIHNFGNECIKREAIEKIIGFDKNCENKEDKKYFQIGACWSLSILCLRSLISEDTEEVLGFIEENIFKHLNNH